ncbi:MAG: hypothetical protein K6G65_06865 [Lachnospiraceae bacterium]|nr:hypothetical protein [Lachnospiraceae bacterium]
MADENKKTMEKKEAEKLDLNDLKKASGGTDPFASIGRQDNKKIDDPLKKKV